jgi:tryptophan-rich sensory protein
VSSPFEPLFAPLTLFGALAAAGAIVASLVWLVRPAAGLPWRLPFCLGLLALVSVPWMYVFVQGDEERVTPRPLASAAVLLAGVGLLVVALVVRRRRRRQLLAQRLDRG